MRLESNRYEEIAKTSFELFVDYGIVKFPIDVFLLAKKMGIIVYKYSEFNSDDRLVIMNGSDDGLHWRYDNQFYIAYNDLRINTRIRFTIAHEIGHIVLGHTETTDENESEADFFARNLLVPPCVLLEKKIDTEEDIMLTFNVSLSVATHSLNVLNSRLMYGHRKFEGYEIALLKHFNLYEEDKT